MANPEHLDILKQGVEVWNDWRLEQRDVTPDLRGANLRGMDLSGADLSNAILMEANLVESNLQNARLWLAPLISAYLVKANLNNADLTGANLSTVRFREATLTGARLNGADLFSAFFYDADLRNADLSRCSLVSTVLQGCDLTGARIYGTSAWDVDTQGAIQKDLIITPPSSPAITVDNLEVAQFIYLLLNNRKIRDVIDTINSKAVLILGRFTPERKIILDSLREELRRRNYLPILFDFDKPDSRNLTETVSTLAHIARFVIADITDAKSIPQELQKIVPNLPSLPVQPLILSSQYEYGMFKDFLDYPWVLPPHRYSSLDDLFPVLSEKIVVPAVTKAKEIKDRRAELEQF